MCGPGLRARGPQLPDLAAHVRSRSIPSLSRVTGNHQFREAVHWTFHSLGSLVTFDKNHGNNNCRIQLQASVGYRAICCGGEGQEVKVERERVGEAVRCMPRLALAPLIVQEVLLAICKRQGLAQIPATFAAYKVKPFPTHASSYLHRADRRHLFTKRASPYSEPESRAVEACATRILLESTSGLGLFVANSRPHCIRPCVGGRRRGESRQARQ